MIAMKREVAVRIWRVFRGANVKLGNWRQVTVQVQKPSTGWTCVKKSKDTHGDVYSRRLSYCII